MTTNGGQIGTSNYVVSRTIKQCKTMFICRITISYNVNNTFTFGGMHVSESGNYDFSLLAGATGYCEMRLYNTEGTYNQVLQYSTPLNTYGGDIPADDTQSCVYVSPVTVTLPEGTYFVEVSFDGMYQIGDVVLVHSAYLTKN